MAVSNNQKNYEVVVNRLAGDDEQLSDEMFSIRELECVEYDKLGEDCVMVRLHACSVDPAFRAAMRSVPLEKYMIQPCSVGQVFKGFAIGKVVASRNAARPVGSLVGGGFWVSPWRLFECYTAEKLPPLLQPPPGVSETHFLGAAGMPGVAAKVPIDQACSGMEEPTGKTALVTGAAGAVGSLAVQLLCKLGMRVVACAGTQEKCQVVLGLGAAACWNYREETDPAEALSRHAPQGIDFFFDNVGGAVLDAALKAMNKGGVILACGAISGYDQAPVPLNNWFYVTVNRLR